ncbi:threonylcarbamoyl-AMP synthase [Candidatus Poribacteria bacterium]|nr:threonylcarbamoyl-AMP synthase [Candidatus Poribacteria bacterium]
MTAVVHDMTGIGLAREAVERGELIAFPTDTVYGVGADPQNRDALGRLFDAKGRDAGKPIPLLFADLDVLVGTCRLSPTAERLSKAFLPGAMTLVVHPAFDCAKELTSSDGTIGVRIPAHEGARALIRACRGMLAVTSANLSGEPPATSAEDVAASIGEHVAVILDGGATPGSIASTVIDTTCEPPRILRQGVISAERIQSVLDEGERP